MTRDFRHSYWKVVSGEKEFVEIQDKLMNSLPGCFGEDPEILCMRIGDPAFDDNSELGVHGIVVTVWLKNNVEYRRGTLEEILKGLEDWER